MEIKISLKPIESFLAKHWKQWTIVAIFVMVIYLGLIVYKYVYKPIYNPGLASTQKTEIKQNIYEEIMIMYSHSQEKLNLIFNKTYPNPFK